MLKRNTLLSLYSGINSYLDYVQVLERYKTKQQNINRYLIVISTHLTVNKAVSVVINLHNNLSMLIAQYLATKSPL